MTARMTTNMKADDDKNDTTGREGKRMKRQNTNENVRSRIGSSKFSVQNGTLPRLTFGKCSKQQNIYYSH